MAKTKKAAKPGPDPERLKIKEDPEKALQKLLTPKPKPESKPEEKPEKPPEG